MTETINCSGFIPPVSLLLIQVGNYIVSLLLLLDMVLQISLDQEYMNAADACNLEIIALKNKRIWLPSSSFSPPLQLEC